MGQILGYYEGSVEEFVADGLDQSTPSGDITFILGNGNEGDGFCVQNKVFKCGGSSEPTLPAYAEYTGTATAVVVDTKYGYFPDTLVEGARVAVKFEGSLTYITSLNVNGTGAKNVYYKGNSLTSGMIARYNTYDFIFDGTYWRIIGVNTDTDTHYTAKNIVGASTTAKANAAATNGNVHLNLVENSTVRSTHNIKGENGVEVTSDASGNITISGSGSGGSDITVDDTLNANSTNPVQNKVISEALSAVSEQVNNKQEQLVSGANIKTVNGQSLLGSGDIPISGGGGVQYVEASPYYSTISINRNTFCTWSPEEITNPLTVSLNTEDADYGTIELLLRIGATQPDSITFTPDVHWKNGKQPILDANKVFRFYFAWGNDGIMIGSWEAYPLYIQQKEVINLHVMTINAKTEYGDYLSPSVQRWGYRADDFLGFVLNQLHNNDGYFAPICDIIGLQEVAVYNNGDQLADITSAFEGNGYSLVIAARGNTSSVVQDSEACIIAYRNDKFTRVSGGYFWLRGGGWNGDTGDFNQEGYSYWDKTYQENGTYDIKKRIAVWVILRENKTGKEIFVLNTHYNQYFNEDNVAMSTPYYSSEIVKNRIDALSGGRPVIFMGDLHCNPDKSAISILKPTYYKLHDTRDRADEVLGMKYTMNSWQDEELSPTYALFDYIFTTDDFKVQSHITANAMVNGKYISDHNPVIVDLSLEV